MTATGGNMLDRVGWMPVTCEEADEIRRRDLFVSSTLTDLDGEFGDPVMYIEWGSKVTKVAMLREYRWFDGRPCEHLTPMVSA